MKRYKFSELLKYEEKIKKLYSKHGLILNPTSRIVQYFVYLRKLEEARKQSPEAYKKLFIEDKVKFYFSQLYVMELFDITNALKKSNTKTEIIKNKLSDLSKGTYLLSEEDITNTRARDTMFELSLFAFLQKLGLSVGLCDPNPDIKLTSNNFTYNIECKRPSSMASIEHQLKKAKKQLDKTTKENTIPTIALSLEQILLKKALLEGGKKYDVLLDSKNEASARAFLDVTLLNFLKENNFLLGKVFKNKSCLVLYYISSLAGFRTNLPMAHATFMTGNIFNFSGGLANSVMQDLYTMIPTAQ